jgi:hypothetical protein
MPWQHLLSSIKHTDLRSPAGRQRLPGNPASSAAAVLHCVQSGSASGSSDSSAPLLTAKDGGAEPLIQISSTTADAVRRRDSLPCSCCLASKEVQVEVQVGYQDAAGIKAVLGDPSKGLKFFEATVLAVTE